MTELQGETADGCCGDPCVSASRMERRWRLTRLGAAMLDAAATIRTPSAP